MQIEQLHVTRYGPMTPFENDDMGRFTLIHGPNERGKTLLIDALVRLLFKKELRKTARRHFGIGSRNMNRVSENPEGYVVLKTTDGEHKLESNQTLNDVFHSTITPEDFRNVFVVRDGDLSMRDEDKYYSRVSEKLTGLRSSEIEKLMQAIQKRGRLRSAAPDSELANNVEMGKIADKVRDARHLVGEIRALKEALLGEKYDELERELVAVRDRLRVLGQEAKLQRAAEETKRFKKARRVLGELDRTQRTLARLQQLEPEQLKRWQKLVTRRESTESDVVEEKRETERIEREIRGAKKALAAQEARTREAEERLKRINAELKPRIDEYQYERAEFRRLEPQSGTYRKGLFATAGLTALALIGYLIHPSLLIAAIGVAALAVWLMLGVKQLQLRAAEGRLRARMDRLKTDSKRLGIELESADEVISTVGDLERDVVLLQQESQARRGEVDDLIKEKRRIENRIAGKAETIAELDAELLALRTETRMKSVGEYQSALERRTKLEASADAKKVILQDLIPTDQTDDAAMEEWRTRIDAHLQAAAEGTAVDYDAEALKRITTEVGSLEARKREIQGALLQGSRKLHGVEVRAKELGVLETSPPCRTTSELDHIGSLLVAFTERIERDRRTAQDAIRICQLVDAEERARVSDLFGPGSPVTGYFSEITGGRYREVHYDPAKNFVYLVDAEGDRVPAASLSGGAYDQLYLAIRVTIATKLLADEKGFLILDDPFVKADADRLEQMFDVLRRLAKSGWQILYFSAKEEVKQMLAADVAADRVRLISLEAPRLQPLSPEKSDVPGKTGRLDGTGDRDRGDEAGNGGGALAAGKAKGTTGQNPQDAVGRGTGASQAAGSDGAGLFD
jgi:exonuclease SbcC